MRDLPEMVDLAAQVARVITEGPADEWTANRDRFDELLGEEVMVISMGNQSATALAQAFREASRRHLSRRLSPAERAEVDRLAAESLNDQGYSVKVPSRTDLRLVTEDEFEQMAYPHGRDTA